MSAIDFAIEIERLPDPIGNRLKVAMSGKFLSDRSYGAIGNEQALDYQEE